MSRVTVGAAVFTAFVSLFVLSHGLEAVDRGFVVDDAYYTLTIARSLAHGGVPSVDGIETTTGFQPLLALLEVPAFLANASTSAGALWGLGVLAIANLISIVAIARLAFLAGGIEAERVAAVFGALSAVAIIESCVGLEAPLAVATTATTALVFHRFRAAPTVRRALLLGACSGLCVLARIDTAFFLAAVFTVVLAMRNLRRSVAACGAALAICGPWLLYCFVKTGRPMPESGAAVLSLTQQSNDLVSVGRRLGFAGGFLAPGTVTDVPDLRQLGIEHPFVGALVGVAVLAALVMTALRAPLAVRLWVLGATVLAPIYVFVIPAIWGYHRYLLSTRFAMTLVLALATTRLLARLGPQVRRGVSGLGSAALALLFVLGIGERFVDSARGTLDGTTGYRASALATFALVEKGAVVGAMQSGALGYFHPEGVRVCNLDGVVSGEAHRAFVAHHMESRLHACGVTYVADWRVGLNEVFAHSTPGSFSMAVVGRGPSQGEHRFHVAKLSWP